MTSTSLWDLYLDPSDARPVLVALQVLEAERAVREPLPLHDLPRLLARLRTIARISAEEAGSWVGEAGERALEADVDGGRWGSVETADRMAAVARGVAESSRRVADAALHAIDDLEPRLALAPTAEARAAAEATAAEVRELLARRHRQRGQEGDTRPT